MSVSDELIALSYGGECGTCGFQYREYNGHIIPCPRCALDTALENCAALSRALQTAREALKPFIEVARQIDAVKEENKGKLDSGFVEWLGYGTPEEHEWKRLIALGQPEPASGDGWSIEKLKELIKHCRIHSGYPNCGYREMTTEQKQLYDAIWAEEVDAPPASEPQEKRK